MSTPLPCGLLPDSEDVEGVGSRAVGLPSPSRDRRTSRAHGYRRKHRDQYRHLHETLLCLHCFNNRRGDATVP